jgi:hypothetical protein
VNFQTIGEYMESLEILNSKFTSKAGEWALVFCAKETGAKKLDEIIYLNLSGRGILMMADISIFS